jgi:hypothetical protein
MRFSQLYALGAFALLLAASPTPVRADSVSFTDVGTYGVNGLAVPQWEGAAVATASFLITFDPTQIYPVQPLGSIITALNYSVNDPRFAPASLTLNDINEFEYAYGTLTLYSDSSKAKDNLAGTPNIIIGINGWTNPNALSSVWYSQIDFPDTLTTNGPVTIEVAPVPIPAALPLFAGGLGLLGWMFRRRRAQAAHA